MNIQKQLAQSTQSNTFASDLYGELKRVSWPTREQTIRLTSVVIIISLIIGTYIGIIDSLLAYGLHVLTSLR